jgi:hypothetical protein
MENRLGKVAIDKLESGIATEDWTILSNSRRKWIVAILVLRNMCTVQQAVVQPTYSHDSLTKKQHPAFRWVVRDNYY